MANGKKRGRPSNPQLNAMKAQAAAAKKSLREQQKAEKAQQKAKQQAARINARAEATRSLKELAARQKVARIKLVVEHRKAIDALVESSKRSIKSMQHLMRQQRVGAKRKNGPKRQATIYI